MDFSKFSTYLSLAAAMLISVSCASKSVDAPVILKGRPQVTLAPSSSQVSGTRLAAAISPSVKRHPGKSGFRLLDRADDAFLARLAMIEAAEKTLDAQYYVWRTDATGTVLLERLMAAADRGVRVRLLVDDMLYGRDDSKVAALTVHPNVEVRLYNPLKGDGTQAFKRYWDLLTNFGELNHRMHNKFMIADNQVVITGGRNVGNKYYGVNKKLVFRDVDVVAYGPVVAQSSGAFDAYWNSERSRPVEGRFRDFLNSRDTDEECEELREKVAGFINEGHFPYPARMDARQAVSLLRPTGVGFGPEPEPMFWCPARLVVDTLAKGDEPGLERGSMVAEEIERLALSATKEIVVETAYLVPRERMLGLLQQNKHRGIEMRLLTNSIASTNQMSVHAFYQKTRRELIESGVDLYEVNTDAESRAIHSASPEAHLGLHAKTLVIDAKTSFVGTFNIDPRSAKWNSEAGVVIESEAFAKHLLKRLARDFDPANSWRVTIDENGRLVWEGEQAGQPIKVRDEPGATGGLRFKSWLYGILPIADQV